MSSDINDTNDQVTLYLDDGTELLCDVVAIYPCGGRQYIALFPVDAEDDSDGFLFRLEGDPNGDEEDLKLIDIESDDEFDEASDAFYEYLDDQEFEEFMDEEDEV